MCVGSPTAGAWSSFQRRPDDEFETDRFYVYGKARAWWYCYHALLLAVCGAHLAIVLTSVRELWPLLVVQSWQLGGFAIYALGILPFTVLIVAAPLLRDRVQQKRSAVESILPGDAGLPA